MEDLLNQALLLFGSAALGLLSVGLGWLTNWLAKKCKSEHWAGVIMKTDDVALKIVRDIYQSYVDPLKVANQDGKLTEAEKKHAKEQALDQLKSYLGTKGLNEIASLVSAGKLDSYLGTVIENAVSTSKNTGKLARRARPTRPVLSTQ